MKEENGVAEWFARGLDFRTLVLLLSNVAMAAWFSATINSRITALELHQVQIDTFLQKEVIPRSELELRLQNSHATQLCGGFACGSKF